MALQTPGSELLIAFPDSLQILLLRRLRQLFGSLMHRYITRLEGGHLFTQSCKNLLPQHQRRLGMIGNRKGRLFHGGKILTPHGRFQLVHRLFQLQHHPRPG